MDGEKRQTDTELIRFRIDPQIRDRAEQVCADQGLELSDVLRTLVTRIAREGALPPGTREMSPEPARASPPFRDYNETLWSGLKPRLDAELSLALLARFIADCSTRIFEAGEAEPVDQALVRRLSKARATAVELRRNLDVADPAAVKEVLATYGALVRREES